MDVEDVDRRTLTDEQGLLLRAWDLSDRGLIPARLVVDNHLTSEGTRLLLDAWDIRDTQSA